jgi:hypothetical protein
VSRNLLGELHVLKIAVILTIRTYALYGGSKRLLICLIIIIIGLAISASVRFRSSRRLVLIVSRWKVLGVLQAMQSLCRELAAMKHTQQQRTSFSSPFCVPIKVIVDPSVSEFRV